MWSIYSQTVMTPGFSFSFVFLGFSMSNQKWKTSLACLQSQILFCKVRWKGSENIWCTSHMFLITSINGSEGAWMQKSKQKTTIGDSLDQQCQPMPEAFESLSPDFANFNYYDSWWSPSCSLSTLYSYFGSPTTLFLLIIIFPEYILFVSYNRKWTFLLQPRYYC